MCTIISWCLLLLVVVAAATGWFSRLFISWWKMWKLPANCNWVGQFSSAAATTTTTWCDMMCIVVIYYILLVTWMEVNRCFLSKDRQQKSSSSRSEMSFKQISSSWVDPQRMAERLQPLPIFRVNGEGGRFSYICTIYNNLVCSFFVPKNTCLFISIFTTYLVEFSQVGR